MPSVFCQSVTILVLYANRTDRSSTRHKLIHSGNFIRINQIYWGTSGITTKAINTTMFLLTIFNPFLTRELRTTGFEGVATEICLIQRANKTDRQHACKTEYLVMFHGREESVKSTNVARNKRMSTDSSPQLEPRRMAKWRLSFCRRPHARGLRALWPRAMSTAQVRQINDGPQPISSKVQHTNPGLACSPDKAQIEVPGSGRLGPWDSKTSSGREVSRDRQRLRPLSFFLCRITFSFHFHACLSKPAAVSLTAESSTCRQV